MCNESKHFEKFYKLSLNHCITFAGHMKKLIKEYGIKDKFDFEERTKLNYTYLRNLTKDGYTPSKKALVSICIGLELNRVIANDLLTSLGYGFKPDNRRDCAYQYILEYYSEAGIKTANMILKELGFKGSDLLGSKDEDEDK